MKIDKLYYINLEHRVDRKLNMEYQCSKFDIPHERFPGVVMDWEECMKHESRFSDHFNRWKDIPHKRIRVSSTISCFYSHKNLLESIQGSSDDVVCLMEDDITIHEDVFDFEPPTNWDMIRDVWRAPKGLRRFEGVHRLSNQRSNLPTHSVCGGLHFYIVKVSKIPKILDYLKDHNLLDIDAVLSTCLLDVYYGDLRVELCHLANTTDIPKL